MDAFATVEDLVAGWKPLDEAEAATAAVLLSRASTFLRSLLAANGVAIDGGDELQAENLKTVTCNMVRRSMSAPDDGLASMSQTVGSTSASVSWSNADGAFYLTSAEKLTLGLSGRKSRYRSIQAHTCADEGV